MPLTNGIYYSISGGNFSRLFKVVLIHGAGSTHLVWPAELRRIGGYKVLAVDLPGHGRSQGLAQQSIEAYADHLKRFLESAGLYHVVLVGHSMGAAIALTLALKEPELVVGLGLISVAAYLGGEAEFLEYLSNPMTVPKGIQLFQQKAFGSGVEPTLVKRITGQLMETRQGVLYNDWLACTHFDLKEHIHRIEVPAWVAVGSEDHITPPLQARALADGMERATLQVITGAGHMLPLESPEILSQGLVGFLERLAQRYKIDGYRKGAYKNNETGVNHQS
jgi:pimeloyl-ACP methyl ester carboxylesterase